MRIVLCFVSCMAVAFAFGASDPYDYKELVEREVSPVKVMRNAAGRPIADFGRDAIGWLELKGDGAATVNFM